ncbi:expression site-associated gene (ESAG-like) protein [Trypanosoma theileri]|uniref:Expression site-associated gene (ESAG-like) protein n=1 Tax=Trypanosoma theileri TaxID=67003 RepID=A0A1X0NVT6_9TRYP|nr:expression site-associated gene (ESAG-like) protein [Trypanosoma theileri]ORC88805.1 expression site-associated gene (ESAG-like) protein [Trypanosoma theileri]
MLASAILSNVSVETIGYGRRYKHTDRVFWVMQYIEKERLRDSDVVVVYDGADTLFSGASTVQQAVDRFIATTAPTPDAFDAGAVRRGVATAPVLFSAEANCYHPQLTDSGKWGVSKGRCISAYWRAYNYWVGGCSGDVCNEKLRLHYLNAGGYVARVWALKQTFVAFRDVLQRKRWWCDQSAWGLVYLWSITQDARMTPDVRIPRGLINLDFHNEFFFSLHSMRFEIDILFWSSTAIANVVAGGRLPFPLFFNIVDKPNATPAILHFNGLGRNVGFFLEKMRNHTSWYVENKRSVDAAEKARDMLKSYSRIKVCGDGDCNLALFSQFCPVFL